MTGGGSLYISERFVFIVLQLKNYFFILPLDKYPIGVYNIVERYPAGVYQGVILWKRINAAAIQIILLMKIAVNARKNAVRKSSAR